MDVSGPTLSNNQPNCSGSVYEVTFTVTDDCGRSESCVQRVFIENEGPAIECPADVTLSCINEYEEGIPTVTTSCDLGYTMDVSGPTLSNNQPNCLAAHTKPLRATDDCGRSESCVQRVFIENEGPTIECPADVTPVVSMNMKRVYLR